MSRQRGICNSIDPMHHSNPSVPHERSERCAGFREQPAPGAPFADIGEFHEAANHDSHAAASPRSGMGAREHDEPWPETEDCEVIWFRNHKRELHDFWWKYDAPLGMNVEWLKFAEAYAADQVLALQHDFKSQEALAVSWEQQFLKATEQEITEREARERAEGALRELQEKVSKIQKWGHGSYGCHIAPDRNAIEANKKREADGERIRAELEDFLTRNDIVGIMLDTEKHVVRVDINKLPPNIKPVLTLWGSIFVVDEPELAALKSSQEEGKL